LVFRNPTATEIEDWKSKPQEERCCEGFKCPTCGAASGVQYHDGAVRVETCRECGNEFYAWAVPATAYASAKKTA